MIPKSSSLPELDAVLGGFRRVFVRVGVLSLVINLLMLAPSLYMLQVYDRVLTSRNDVTLIMLTVIILGLYGLMGLLEWVRSHILIRLGTRLDTELNLRVFGASFQRGLRRQGGSPAQALQDLTTLRQFVAGNGTFAFFDAPWAPIYLLVITLVHPWLGLFSLVGMLVLTGLALANEWATHKPLEEAGKQSMGAQLYAANSLRNAEAIEAMGMLPDLQKRWLERQHRFLALQSLASERGSNISSITKAVRITFQSLILGLGAFLAIRGEITPGSMIAASILMGRALAPVELLIGVWKQWLAAQSAYGRLKKLLYDFPARPPAMPLPAPLGHLDLENVTAVPPGSTTPVLRGLALRIRAGDAVGVIGPSAAGKSSLARLLVGVWPPAAGHVRLDGADISSWDKRELGPHIGYLPQGVELFDGTIAENIARFGEENSESIVAAAKMAGVHDMILHLPQGYNSQAGVDGAALSAGQRQRVALARALYGEPKLVVLDEPNSNLDEAGEMALAQAIQTLKQRGVTVVVITHRSNILAVVDKLICLQEGALAAYGPRDQVLEHLRNPKGNPQPQSGHPALAGAG